MLDPSGAVIVNALVDVRNPVSGFSRNAATDAAGKFTIPNVPFNPYHVMVTAKVLRLRWGVDVRSTVPVDLSIALKVEGSSESVTVEANGEDFWKNPLRFTPTSIAACSTNFPLRASHLR